VGRVGERLRLLKVALLTVSAREAVRPPYCASRVAEPEAIAVTVPFAATESTPVSELLRVAAAVTFAVVPSE
jgi:hypothetical protein